MKNNLHFLIFAAMGLGVLAGLLLWNMEHQGATYAHLQWWLKLFGREIFVGFLKMLVMPLIFVSIVAGITSLRDNAALASLGVKTFVYYLGTTTVAVLIGLCMVLVIRPGMRGNRGDIRAHWPDYQTQQARQFASKVDRIHSAEARTPGAGDIVLTTLRDILSNPFQALTARNSLGVIFFAILLGLALIAVGDAGETGVRLFGSLNAAIMRITAWVMRFSPWFIFCLMASIVADHGVDVFKLLGWYAVTVILGIAVHVGVLLAVCRLIGKRSPVEFLKGIRKAWAVAFSTRSSAATLPVTVSCLKEELNVSAKAADFVLPIGATVNMDGTALYEGVAVIFLIQLFGGLDGVPVAANFGMVLVIFLTAVLASIGAAAVPDAGLITMVLVAGAVNMDPAYITFIFAIDAFLDMFRTSTNVMGDAVGAVVVDRLCSKKTPTG